jgi:outer membrane protein assembly factor BamB
MRRTVSIAALSMALVLVASIHASAVGWRQFGHDAQHTGFNPRESRIRASNVADLQYAFSLRAGKAAVTQPVVVGGVVYFGARHLIRAFDSGTGAPLWLARTCSRDGDATMPAYARGRIWVGSGTSLTAVDADTGAPFGCWATDHLIASPPTAAGGTVYVATGVQKAKRTEVLAVDAASGQEQWSVKLPGGVGSVPTVQGHALFVSSCSYTGGIGGLYRLDASNGSIGWVDPSSYCYSPASVSGRTLFVGGAGLEALDTATGSVRWRRSTGVLAFPPAIADGRVIVSAQDPGFGVFAFDQATGERLWRDADDPNESEAAPTVVNGVAFVVNLSGQLYALRARSGQILATPTSPSGAFYGQSVTVVNGSLYAAGGDATSSTVDVWRLPEG